MGIADFCSDRITWEPAIDQDGHGGAVYGPPVTLVCRVEQKLVFNWTPTGAVYSPGTMIYFPTIVNIGPNDRITLADGSQPTIRMNKANKALNFAHHTTLTLR